MYQVLHLLSYPGGGVPHPWTGGTPSMAGGYPISGRGTPPPTGVDSQTENITFPILRMRAVLKPISLDEVIRIFPIRVYCYVIYQR